MIQLWAAWLILAGLLLIAEMVTLTFYLLWLGLGALAAAIVAYAVLDSFALQVAAGAVTALLLTIYSKPLTRRIRAAKGYRDAIDELVGKEGIVVEDIEPGRNGIVRIGNETWSATGPGSFRKGERVIVIKRSSTFVEVNKQGE